MAPSIDGVFAAAITPIDHSGAIDFEAFARVLDFLIERGVNGIAIGGATGEYIHFSSDQRLQLAEAARKRLPPDCKLFVNAGTSSVHSTIELAKAAAGLGSDALLLPMPYFFRYQQQDLISFCETVCGAVSSSFLLYNLPSFTNPMLAETAIQILKTIPNMAGMKDSSGERLNLAPLAAARDEHKFSLLVGDDSLLLPALMARWNGVISGIACFVPELISAISRAYRSGDQSLAAAEQVKLDELIEWVVKLPIPWAVRAGLAARGIANGPMHVPPSADRIAMIQQFQNWLGPWLIEHSVVSKSA